MKAKNEGCRKNVSALNLSGTIETIKRGNCTMARLKLKGNKWLAAPAVFALDGVQRK